MLTRHSSVKRTPVYLAEIGGSTNPGLPKLKIVLKNHLKSVHSHDKSNSELCSRMSSHVYLYKFHMRQHPRAACPGAYKKNPIFSDNSEFVGNSVTLALLVTLAKMLSYIHKTDPVISHGTLGLLSNVPFGRKVDDSFTHKFLF